MKPVTRNIDLDRARDLLERIPRACLAFASDRGPEAWPCVLVYDDHRFIVGIADYASPQPRSGEESVLLVDEGAYFFDLRVIYVRGRVQAVERPKESPAGYNWVEVIPLKITAWDYGMLREVDDGAG